MTTPFLIWGALVALLVILLMCRAAFSMKGRVHRRDVIGMESERNEFFIPGDCIRPDDSDYDCYD